jgi:hypothetical protein
MATFAYALRTNQRKRADAEQSVTVEPPGSGTWLDAMAALIPAEVLALHALAISRFTSSADIDEGVDIVSTPEGQPSSPRSRTQRPSSGLSGC